MAKEIWDRVRLLMKGMELSQQERECKLYNEFDSLQPEWSKFMTDVKLARDLRTTNCDQLYAYLNQHEQMYSPSPQSRPYEAPHHIQQHQNAYQPQLSHKTPSIPQNPYHAPPISQQPQAEFPQPDLGLAVPSFLPCDEPIA
ncbi:hypothetical protein Tco_1198953 [Tanacetum coccineum]